MNAADLLVELGWGLEYLPSTIRWLARVFYEHTYWLDLSETWRWTAV